MKRIIQNEFYANLHLKKAEKSKTYNYADVAFLCSIAKINDIKSKQFQKGRIVR